MFVSDTAMTAEDSFDCSCPIIISSSCLIVIKLEIYRLPVSLTEESSDNKTGLDNRKKNMIDVN